METHVVFCSACDRDVHVAFTAPPRALGRAGGEVDPSGICLDYSAQACTGSTCALFDLPPAEIAAKLQHSGLGTRLP
jgi:hypothetical protein